MKHVFIVASCLVVSFIPLKILAQEEPSHWRELLENIKKTEGKTKLVWLDSLATEVQRSPNYNYDSLAVETIALSIELDTVDVGAYHVVNRMYNIAGQKGLIEGLAVFDSFRIAHVDKLKNNRRISNFYKAGALLYYNTDDYDLSQSYYDKALLSALKTTDSQAIGEIYMGKGMNFFSQGKLLASSTNLQESIPYFEASGGVNAMMNVKNVMTSLYSSNGFYEQAAKEREEAMGLAKESGHQYFISQIKFNHGTEMITRQYLEKSVPLFEEALEHLDQSRYAQTYRPIYLSQLASVNARLNRIKVAVAWFDMLEKEPRKNNPGETKAYYLSAKMDIAFAKANYKRALEIGEEYKAYKLEISQTQGLERAELFLSKVQKELGRNDKALSHYQSYQAIKDSVTGVQKANGLSYYQTLYETEKRDATIAEQQGDIALLDASNRMQRQWLIFGSVSLLLLIGVLYFWKARKASLKEKKLQQQFSQDLLNAQEEERKNIAKELHDGIGQDLLLIKNSLTINPKDSGKMVDKTIEDIRAISRNLHPVELEKFGLTKAIENLVERVGSLTSIYFTDDIDNIDLEVSEEQSINLYRIIQECINNIIKHSEATASKVSVEDDKDKITVTVQDNGIGFKVVEGRTQSRSLGLKSLTERVAYLKGTIDFDSQPEKGTIVKITLYK